MSSTSKRKHSRTSNTGSSSSEKRSNSKTDEPDSKHLKRDPPPPVLTYTPPSRDAGGSLGGLPLYGESLPSGGYDDIPPAAKNVTDKLTQIFSQVKELKSSGKECESEIKSLRTSGILLFANLRKLNRLSNIYIKDSRDKTLEKKLSVDELYLKLQNLQYEAKHLDKEINSCLEFKSKHEDLDLISEKEFYETAPESLTEVTKTDSHKLMLARLEWEMKQREQLSSRQSSLEAAINSKQEQTLKLEDKLSKLHPSLEQLRIASRPLEEFLDVPLSWEREQHRLAALLPRPLYVLYVQAEGYSAAEDSLLKVIVNGSADEARAFTVAKQQNTDKERDETEDKAILESADVKKKKRRKSTKQSDEDQQLSLRAAFPLSVSLQITVKNIGTVTLSFYYLPYFNAVCSSVTSFELIDKQKIDNFTDKSSFLFNLFEGDSGKTSPNSAVSVQIRKYGGTNFTTAVRQYGFPYKWVQQVCGINISTDFSNTDFNALKLDTEMSFISLVEIVTAARERMKSQLSLSQQLTSLNQLTLGQGEGDNMLSQFIRWESLSLSDVQKSQFGGLEIFNLQERSNRFFLANFTQGQARWYSIICLSPEYPKIKPVFSLCIELTEKQKEPYDLQIKNIEAEVNVRYPMSHDISGCGLLLAQLRHMRSLVENYINYRSRDMRKSYSISPRGKGRLFTSHNN